LADQFHETMKSVLVPIHREGWPFVTLFAIVTLVLGLIWTPFWVLGGILTAWCAYFFRDPDRVTPTRPSLVVSPADGVVQMIREVPPPPELEMGEATMTRISIFMNVFNVHVNRIPVDGTISKLDYRPGAFLNASLDKASEENEHQSIRMEAETGQDIAFVQIAGLVARRILCELEPGQAVKAGERFGMIRFGSRVDVYVPRKTNPLVVEGQAAIAGETVLADLKSREKRRQGEVR